MTTLGENNQRIEVLDGLRGMAIFAAVIYHYANNLIDADASQFNLTLKSLTQFFYTSIDMFFLLSGFLLGGILLKNKQSPNFFKTFYMRRVYRIIPLYFLLLFVVGIICFVGIGRGTDWWFHQELPFWIYFTFLQNIFIGITNTLGNAWLSPSWSLGVEEQFYLIISFLIYFSPKRTLIFILTAGIIAAPVFRYHAPTVFALSTFTYCRFDALFGGILLAIVYQDAVCVSFIKKHIGKLQILTLGLFAVSFLFSVGKWHMALYLTNSWFTIIYAAVILLVLVDSQNIFHRLASYQFFVRLGLYSFSIYLFHEIILGLFFFLIPGKLPQIHSVADALMVALCAILTYFVARFLYLHLEKRFMALGHQYNY
jgi:peptidoglycan/LPS O-acetylase OafA/YrhL